MDDEIGALCLDGLGDVLYDQLDVVAVKQLAEFLLGKIAEAFERQDLDVVAVEVISKQNTAGHVVADEAARAREQEGLAAQLVPRDGGVGDIFKVGINTLFDVVFHFIIHTSIPP